MSEQPKLKARSTIWKKIRRLELPEEIKETLRTMWHQAKALVERLVEWLYHKRHLTATVALGVALAYLCHYVPIVGPLLADLAISSSVLVGLVRQMRADLDRFFDGVVVPA
ncbi:MAG: hypothetical protein ACPGUC_07650 [Gammaproteobacteria bacterium]